MVSQLYFASFGDMFAPILSLSLALSVALVLGLAAGTRGEGRREQGGSRGLI
ncbi:hypothetical protein FMGBMHLM_0268 [Methylobacterium aerolatum]|nr:hypothetical protein FMGBMHLM_0268 [Methylobacterium aerolatum]